MRQGRYLLNAMVIMCFLAFMFNHFNMPILETGMNTAQANQDSPSNIAPLGISAIQEKLTSKQERPRLLVIYASWCPYCKKLIQALESYSASNQGLQIIGLSIDEDYNALSRYLSQWNGTPYFGNDVLSLSARSNFKQLMRDLGIPFNGGIPHLALFDKSGTLRFERKGLFNTEVIDGWMKQL